VQCGTGCFVQEKSFLKGVCFPSLRHLALKLLQALSRDRRIKLRLCRSASAQRAGCFVQEKSALTFLPCYP
jgi:hypothetical protein